MDRFGGKDRVGKNDRGGMAMVVKVA